MLPSTINYIPHLSSVSPQTIPLILHRNDADCFKLCDPALMSFHVLMLKFYLKLLFLTCHHLSPPLTSTMSMAQMMCSDTLFGPMVSLVCFFFLSSFFVTNS